MTVVYRMLTIEKCESGVKRSYVSRVKTYQFFLLIENKKLTKIISLTGNDIETTILSEYNSLSFN